MSDNVVPGSEPASYNLLFVCTGNTCRSPIAAAAAQAELARRGWSHVRVASAGTGAAPDAPASEHTVTVLSEHGLDISAHRARAVSPELLEWADLVLAMSPSHLAALAELGAAHKSALITEFLEDERAASGVEDPFGGPIEDYRRTYELLAAAVSRLLDRLEPILAP
jgi:protein-tyrosine-phosphatase